LDRCEMCGNEFITWSKFKKHLWYEHEPFRIHAQYICLEIIFSLNNFKMCRNSQLKRTLDVNMNIFRFMLKT
jgi:hypothetical protein